MQEKQIDVNICTGSTCYAQGRAILTELLKIVPDKYGKKVKVEGVPCLDVCSIDVGHKKAPYVKINNEIMQEANLEKVISKIDSLLSDNN